MNAFNQFSHFLTDPEKLKIFFRKNKKGIIQWCACIALILVLYFLFSDGDFSFFLTLSGIIQMFGFFIVMHRVMKERTGSGISLHTMYSYAILQLARLSSILFFNGYLPLDKSGDWLYQMIEVLSFAFCLAAIIIIWKTCIRTYNRDIDKIKFWWLALPSLIFAILFHPQLNRNWFGDVMWTWALYYEALAMLPQLYLFVKKQQEIESHTSHYVASQGVSKIVGFIFWFFTFDELNDWSPASRSSSMSIAPTYAGYAIFIAQIIQIILMGDFLYHYFKSLKSGLPMTLPTYSQYEV